jgi:hypothetical protein
MNEAPIRTPTLAELRAAGYVVEIEHDRLNRVAYAKNGKLIVKEVLSSEIPRLEEEVRNADLPFGMKAVLPKGGMTEVWVTDPDTSAEFYGFARCHSDDNYDKKTGVLEALKRVAALMLVMDGKEGFSLRLQL